MINTQKAKSNDIISQVSDQNIAIVHQAFSHHFQQNTVIVKHFIDQCIAIQMHRYLTCSIDTRIETLCIAIN